MFEREICFISTKFGSEITGSNFSQPRQHLLVVVLSSLFISFITVKHTVAVAWHWLLDKAAGVAAGLTTGSWLKQEAGHGWLSVEPFDLQTESCRPVYCIFPPECWIKFDKRCFSLVTRETASANREKQREEEPQGACIDYKSGSRLSALCWSMQSRSERELSKQTREWKKKLVDNPITHSQLEWELATHAEGYSAEICGEKTL